jgi:outer membrane protein assembly factor BamB
MNRRHFISALLASVSASWLAGCGRHEAVYQPTPLTAITPSLKLRQGWQQSIGRLARQDVTGVKIARNEQNIYALASSGQVSALTLAGEVRWSWSAEQVLLSGVTLSAGGDKLYVGSAKGVLFALATADASVLWQTALSAEVLSVTEYAGRVFVRLANGRLQAVDVHTGNSLWIIDHDQPSLSVRGMSDPVFVSNGMLLGWEDGTVELMLQENGERVWENRIALPRGRSDIERMIDVQANLLFDGIRVYASATQGKLTAMDIQSGRNVWTTDAPTWVGMSLANERLFVVTADDTVKAISADSGRGLWVQDALKYRRLGRVFAWADWAVCSDMEGVLHLLSAQTGELVGRVEGGVSGAIADLLVIDNAQALLLDTSGKLTQWQIERIE